MERCVCAGVVGIASSHGGHLPCYLAIPAGDAPTPALVLASTIRGIDLDLRAIADVFATRGYIAAAPDLFSRSGRPDASQDGPSRIERIRDGEVDMADVLAHLRTLARFNGRAAVMGLCYGGPYALVGPRRLGFAAGIACHGSQMMDYLDEAERVEQPVCLMWGDADRRAPNKVLAAYRKVAAGKPNVEVRIFPGIGHGYMLPGSAAFDDEARGFSMRRAMEILETLAETGATASSLPTSRRAYEVERRARHAVRPGFRISELQISPSQGVPWHYHTQAHDTIYVIDGRLRLFLRAPAQEIVLGRGDSHAISAGRVHRVVNAGEGSATFLVLQNGETDFIPVD